MVRIETNRLILKTVNLDHCTSNYVNWLNDSEVNQFLDAGHSTHTMDSLKEYIGGLANTKDLFLGIHLRGSGKHIGNVKIHCINSIHRRAEYGIMMGDKSEWGKGYAKEATVAILDYAFNQYNLRKMVLGVIRNNKTAYRLYQKLGFHQEGLLKNDFFHKSGKHLDIIRMAIFKNDWAMVSQSF